MYLLISKNSLKKFLMFKKKTFLDIEDLELLRFLKMVLMLK